MSFFLLGARIAKLGERQTLDHKVTGLLLTWGVVLCPRARHFIPVAKYWLNPGSCFKKTEKLLTRM